MKLQRLKMKLVDKISKDLLEYLQLNSNDIVVPNFYINDYEADVLRVTNSDYLIEYEIKTTLLSFKNDFKKGISKNKWYYKYGKSDLKHKLIVEGKRCNRFFFVCPNNLIPVSEVPSYCGLIYYGNDNVYDRFSIKKNAPLIHKNKVEQEFYKKLARKLAFREIHWRWKYRMDKESIETF